MKLTHTQNMKASKSGMTLLELTVVILVLLSLISILFIGARAWKKGSDRAANILNLRNTQQAVRGHANIRGLDVADGVTEDDIFGTADDGVGAYMAKPAAPATTISYAGGTVVPAVGTLWMTATYTGTGSTDYAPDATSYSQW